MDKRRYVNKNDIYGKLLLAFLIILIIYETTTGTVVNIARPIITLIYIILFSRAYKKGKMTKKTLIILLILCLINLILRTFKYGLW